MAPFPLRINITLWQRSLKNMTRKKCLTNAFPLPNFKASSLKISKRTIWIKTKQWNTWPLPLFSLLQITPDLHEFTTPQLPTSTKSLTQKINFHQRTLHQAETMLWQEKTSKAQTCGLSFQPKTKKQPKYKKRLIGKAPIQRISSPAMQIGKLILAKTNQSSIKIMIIWIQ